MTNQTGGGKGGKPQSEVEAEIMDTVTLRAEGLPGGKARVTVTYTGGESPEVLFSDKLPKDFYDRRTPRGQIKNEVRDALEGFEIDPDAWVAAYKEWVNEILGHSEEAAVTVVNEAVKDLAEGTKRVNMGKAGDGRVWKIELEWNGQTGTLRFDHTDMAKGGATTLETQLFKEFGNCPPGIETEEWESLKAYWLDIQEETFEENVTERDRAKEMFLAKLRERITPYDSPKALNRDKQSVWVDSGNGYGLNLNALASDVDGVAWVRSDLINAVIDEMDNAPRIGELAQELQESRDVVAGSKKLKPDAEIETRRYWFFDPDSLEIRTVHEWDKATDSGDATGVVDA